MRHLSLALALSALWVLLSGHLEPLILGLGLASVVLVGWLARRMAVVDEEGVPVGSVAHAIPYSIWLLIEIVKSNLAMLPVLLAREPDVQPQLLEVPAGEGGSVGRVTYANSITMTPGTVTLEMRDAVITVHALTDATAADLRSGEMERRANAVSGPRRRGEDG